MVEEGSEFVSIHVETFGRLSLLHERVVDFGRFYLLETFHRFFVAGFFRDRWRFTRRRRFDRKKSEFLKNVSVVRGVYIYL
jgi:hypothetical protein